MFYRGGVLSRLRFSKILSRWDDVCSRRRLFGLLLGARHGSFRMSRPLRTGSRATRLSQLLRLVIRSLRSGKRNQLL